GDLANGLVALVLVPNAPGATTAGLADEGGGFTPTRIPIIDRTGHHVTVRAQIVDLFGAEQVIHRQTPPGAAVVRDASQITFYLGPAALGRLAGIKLKVFARSPASGGRRAGARSWPAILNARASEVATLSIDQSELSYTQLANPQNALTGLVSDGVDQELRAQRQTATELKTAVAAY